MDPVTTTHQESEIHLEHLGDLNQNSEKTKQLLDDYAQADKDFKEAVTRKKDLMNSDAGVSMAEESKKVREHKTRKDKLKTDILELIMHGEIKRSGFTKADKKKAPAKEVPTFC